MTAAHPTGAVVAVGAPAAAATSPAAAAALAALSSAAAAATTAAAVAGRHDSGWIFVHGRQSNPSSGMIS